jgi:uncharacterized protein YaiL (DUF2058 family)
MSDSLRDQLLGLGFKAAPKPERKPAPKPGAQRDPRKPQSQAKPHPHPHPQPRPHGKPSPQHRRREDIDLAKAYALRAQREKDERIAAERRKQEEARQRREAKAKLAELLQGHGLNAADAEIARHFNYGGKIKRIYVTEAQLHALNAGELGVVQLDGRYLLVAAALLAQAEAIFPPAVALKVDPSAPAEADPYADPQYQVPDDLVW